MFFGLNFLKKLLPFSKSVPSNIQIFIQKWNSYLYFGEKMLYLAGIRKSNGQIWHQHPQICLIAKFGAKWKSLNFGPKIPLICIYLGSNLKMLLSHLKPASSNLSCCKVWCKNKIPLIWDQKCLIWVFLDWNLKIILPYLKSTPSNFSNRKISWKNGNA